MNIGLCNTQCGSSNSSFLGIGCPATYDVTAASVPDYDSWGPDCSWTANDWINWHKKMLTTSGKQIADAVWAAAFDKVTYLGSETFFASKNPAFKQYVISSGLVNQSQILSQIAKAEKWGNTVHAGVTEPIKNISDTLTNASAAVESSAKSADTLAKWFPYIVLAGVVLIGFIIWNKKSLNVVA